MSKILLFYIALLFIFPRVSTAAVIELPDTTAERGDIIELTAEVETGNMPAGKISFAINYSPDMVRILNVKGGEGFFLPCVEPQIELGPLTEDPGKCLVTCDSISHPGSSLFFVIRIEILAGPDGETEIEVGNLTIGGEPFSADCKPAIITVLSDPVFRRFPENLGMNYPNPFNRTTIFPFTVRSATKVEFEVWSLSGRIQSQSIDTKESFKIFADADKTKTALDLNGVFPKGSYKLEYSPDLPTISSGIYFMRMKTDNGIKNVGFVYMK